MKLLNENQELRNGIGSAIIRDLYQVNDSKISVHKSGWYWTEENKGKTIEEIISLFPVNKERMQEQLDSIYIEIADAGGKEMDDLCEIAHILEDIINPPFRIFEERPDSEDCRFGCGGQAPWCDICQTYTSTCCIDYGTCMCS